MKISKWQILLIPFLVGGCFVLYSVAHYGVNTPAWDEWDMVPLFQKADHHNLGFSDLWAQHNEHRILFPNIVLLLNAYITHWNIKAEALIGFVFSSVTALMLYLLVLSKIKRQGIAIAAAILIAAWFYSPIQYENWLLGWQLEWSMCVAGIVTSLYFIDRFGTSKQANRRLFFGAAMASAVVATYSLADGMLVWPVGLGMLVLYKQSRRPVGIWLAAGGLAIAAYYCGYRQPAGSPAIGLFLHQRLNFMQYTLSYLGSAIPSYQGQALLMGIILVVLLVPALYMVWLRRSQVEKFVPWLALIALAVMSAVITAIGRVGSAAAPSTASRYAAFSLLYVIGLTGLVCTILDTMAIKRQPTGLAILAISIPLLVVSYTYGMLGMQVQSGWLHAVKTCTHQAHPTTKCLFSTSPYPDHNTELTAARLTYVKSKHWAGY